MHIDSFIGVGTIGRFLRDLKDDPIEGDGIIVGHGTLFFNAQRLIDRLGMDLSPSGLGLSGLGEFTVVLAEVAIEHGLRLGNWLWPISVHRPIGPGKFPTIVRSFPWPEGSRLR